MILFTSCLARLPVVCDNYMTAQILIPGELVDIEIIDDRTNVSDKRIKIPTFTFPGQSDKVSPVLSQRHKEMMLNQIDSYFSYGDAVYKVKCYVLTGYKEFTAHAFHEIEFVRWDLVIEVLNTNEELIEQCTSTASLEIKSIDADYNHLDILYEKAMQTALHKCFQKLNELDLAQPQN